MLHWLLVPNRSRVSIEQSFTIKEATLPNLKGLKKRMKPSDLRRWVVSLLVQMKIRRSCIV